MSSRKRERMAVRQQIVTVPGIKVEVKGPSPRDFEQALRTFNKKVQDSGLMRELRDREFFEKPSVIKKRALAAAIKRRQQQEADATAKFEGRRRR